VIPIGVLPDEVLLEIFDFYIALSEYDGTIETWQKLVHVCRRWRNVVFSSPRRLNLRLLCTLARPTKDTLDVWPALLLVVNGMYDDDEGMDNIIAALGQSNRVCQVELYLGDEEVDKEVLAAMQVPFPELTQMYLTSLDDSESAPGISDSFLGGFAPRLRSITFEGIPFYGFPKFFLSATHLVHLNLDEIPQFGYISPEAMAAIISASSNLEKLYINFRSPESRPVSKSPSLPPIRRSILPALRVLVFRGVSEYLEELATHIDTPQLGVMYIELINQIGTPRLAQLINRTSLKAGDLAHVKFCGSHIEARVRALHLIIQCPEPDRQLSSVSQVYEPFHSLSTVERLYIQRQFSTIDYAIENTLWLKLLLPFTAVKELRLSKKFASSIVAALQEPVGGRVLPSLQKIFVEGLEPSGPLQENIGQLVAARQLSGHPIAISVYK
jgi:hypothetical protein